MRRSWIKIETNTPDKPEVCLIASQLRLDSDAVMGKLVRLWSWAELNASSDNDTNVTLEFLDKVVGKKGFSAALIKTGWLEVNGDRLKFPNFSRHNGKEAKSRAQTALRVSRHRAQKAKLVTNETPTASVDPDPVEVLLMTQAPESGENLDALKPTTPLPELDPAPALISAARTTENEVAATGQSKTPEIESLKEISVNDATVLIAETLAIEEVQSTGKRRTVRQFKEDVTQPLLF